MIRTVKILFCDSEHGIGDQMFPPSGEIDANSIVNHPATVKELRAEAKKAGWTYRRGVDLCDLCNGSEEHE